MILKSNLTMASHNDWWHARREELLDLARNKTPLYLYNEETLNETLFDLLSIEAVDRLFYPMYIHSHPKVYEKVYEMDVGFACLSMDDVARVFKLFPGIKPQRLLFMPDSDISEVYESALLLGIHVVVRNLSSLRACQDVLENREIFIGLEMAYDQHGRVEGIHFPEMEALSGLLGTVGTTVSGLYLHSKRCFRPSFDLNGTASVFKGVSTRLPEVSTLILGNGMCICLESDGAVLDIPEMGNRLEAIKEISPQYTLWLDPGPYIISYAGVILTRVIDSFVRAHQRYVRIDLDMPSYAQYASDQPQVAMVNLSKLENEASSFPHMIVSDIENNSRLCHIKGLAPADEGDILLIPNVGAIGLKAGLKSDYDDSDHGYYLKARKMCPVKI
jgi:diaminopimelate decarboxylase/aspartate kinase